MRNIRVFLLLLSLIFLLDHLPRGAGSNSGRHRRRQQGTSQPHIEFHTWDDAYRFYSLNNYTAEDVHAAADNGDITVLQSAEYRRPTRAVGSSSSGRIQRSGSGSGSGSRGERRSGSGSRSGSRRQQEEERIEGPRISSYYISGESGDESLPDLSMNVAEPSAQRFFRTEDDAIRAGLQRGYTPRFTQLLTEQGAVPVIERGEALAREQQTLDLQSRLEGLRVSHDAHAPTGGAATARRRDGRDQPPRQRRRGVNQPCCFRN